MGKTMRALLLAFVLGATSVACDGGSWPGLGFSPDTLPAATVGQPYSAVITISGNQTPVGNVSADVGLPPGLVLHWDESADRNRAELSGTPTAPGTFQLTISAWCLGTNMSGQASSHQYALVVRGAAPAL